MACAKDYLVISSKSKVVTKLPFDLFPKPFSCFLFYYLVKRKAYANSTAKVSEYQLQYSG